jgi:hypothetical protein
VFRFLFIYLIVYNIQFPLTFLLVFARIFDAQLPGFMVQLAQGYEDGWNAVITWIGSHVFGVEITVRPNGSGDTTWNYVQVLSQFVLAVVGTMIWSVLDRKRANYARLSGFLRVYLRYSLAWIMMMYGSVKVIKSQFPDPFLDRLLQPFGDASPMGLLWTFMGASLPYNIFSGAGEMLGGLLLTTRRTTLLGALVCIGVMGHVVMLNFSYDVPVKLFSAHLLLMAIVLAAPDLKRLADLFLFNRPVEPAPIRPLFRWKWVDRAAVLVRTAAVVALVYYLLTSAQKGREAFSDLAAKTPFYGIWNVEEFTIDGQPRPPLVTDAERWKRVVFVTPKLFTVQFMSDKRERYGLQFDEEKKTLELIKRDDKDWKSSLHCEQSGAEKLVLEGTFAGKKVQAKLTRVDESEFLLVNRGFHWINEYPFNR